MPGVLVTCNAENVQDGEGKMDNDVSYARDGGKLGRVCLARAMLQKRAVSCGEFRFPRLPFDGFSPSRRA